MNHKDHKRAQASSQAGRAHRHVFPSGRAVAHHRTGFALVSVLAILVLLMVLVLAISSVIHVETRTSASGRDLLLARQNALLGLDTAIGQLQEYAGKDQAVTFPATTYYPTKDVTTGTGPLFDDAAFGYRPKAVTAKTTGNGTLATTYLTPTERTTWDAALKAWWNASRNPRWTGIMDASLRVDRASGGGATSANATAMAAQRYETTLPPSVTKFGEPKRDQLPVWLVSGNEKFTINQETGEVTDQSGTVVSTGTYPVDPAHPERSYQTPDTVLPDPDADSSVIWLVGEGSASSNATSTDGLDGRVKVRKQDVIATKGGNSTLTGHYAYWVSDESTKANFAARDRTSTDDASYPNDGLAKTSKEYRNRLQVPQRIGWENINLSGNTTTKFQDVATFSPNDPYLENISTSKEIGLLQAAKGDDAKTQQIKTAAKNNFHSLTAFSKSLLTDTALGGLKKDLTVFLEGSDGPAGNSTIMDVTRYLPNDPRLGGNNTGFPKTTTNLPVWQDVKTWQDAMGVGGGQVPVTKGMAPVFANSQLFFAITHKADAVQLHMVPMIALWNPYNAPLQSTTYTLQWRHNFVLSYFAFAVKNPDCPDSSGAAGTRIVTPGGPYFSGPYSRGNPQWFDHPNKFFRADFGNPPNWINGGNFSPFDKNATNNPTGRQYALPDDPSATWVTYQFTTNFEPGEVKVFTVDGMQEVTDPAKLHDGSTVIDMINGFDPNKPGSYYFEIANKLQRNPGPNTIESNLATDDDDVRWFSNFYTYQCPRTWGSIRLKVKGTTDWLWTDYYSGYPDCELATGRTFLPQGDGGTPDLSKFVWRDDPSIWRKVYPLPPPGGTLTFPAGTSPTMSSNAYNSPLVGLWRSQMAPFLPGPDDSGIDSSGKGREAALGKYYRAFAIFNPFASEGQDLIKDLDYVRDDTLNSGTIYNADGFAMLRPLSGWSWNLKWDDNQTTNNGINGFAQLGWQTSNSTSGTDAYGNKMLSTLPVRLVRPAQINTVSLGQLQQVNLGRYFWQPSFVLGNSEASPYVDRSRAAGLQKYKISTGLTGGIMFGVLLNSEWWPHPNNATNQYVDLSYLVNENIWDSYFLSTIPQTGPIPKDNVTPLNNGRHRFRADVIPTDADVRNWLTSGAFLENYGALNVNSTSVEAWKALFTAFRRLSITGNGTSNPDNTVPVSRTLSPTQGPVGLTENATTRKPADYGADPTVSTGRDYGKLLGGFRYLTDAQIQTLAERIVDEVRLRGPFLSLADFVNRRLVSPQGADDSTGEWYMARTKDVDIQEWWDGPFHRIKGSYTLGTMNLTLYDPVVGMSGINGALQRALNLSGINGGMNDPAPSTNNRVFGIVPGLLLTSSTNTRPMQLFSKYRYYLDTEHLAGAPAGEVGQLLSHSPGFVTQGDLLAMVGPALTPRGDTFLVRSYGDAVDKTGKVVARSCIEAIVQRIADPLTPASTSGTDKWRYTDKFGRRFQIVNLRWLRAEEI